MYTYRKRLQWAQLRVGLILSVTLLLLFAAVMFAGNICFTKKLGSPKGSLQKLLEDDSLYNNLNSVSRRLDGVLQEIEKGESMMGKLIYDEALAGELETILRELRALIGEIRDDPDKYFRISVF